MEEETLKMLLSNNEKKELDINDKIIIQGNKEFHEALERI